jgi:hypothetical protein
MNGSSFRRPDEGRGGHAWFQTTFGGTVCPPRDPFRGEAPQALCPGLANVELSVDRSDWRNTIRRQVAGEDLGCPLLHQRV